MLLLALLLLSSVAHAQDDAFVGPPSAAPAATVMSAQVRMVQEGDQLRLLADAMSGDNDVECSGRTIRTPCRSSRACRCPS